MNKSDFKNIGQLGFTLVEVIIGSLVLSMFLSSALWIFFQSQKTITKTSWINTSTLEEGMALRKISELAQKSSFPSTVMEDVIKVADKNSKYFARIPKNGKLLSFNGSKIKLLLFPVCTEQTEASNGTISWASLWLEPSEYPNYCNLVLNISKEIAYSPGPPEYAANLNSGKYSDSLPINRRSLLLHHVEKASIEKLKDSKGGIRLILTLSFPKNNKFKKELVVSPTLNVDVLEVSM